VAVGRVSTNLTPCRYMYSTMPPMLCPIQKGFLPVKLVTPSMRVGASRMASVSMLWLQSPASQ